MILQVGLPASQDSDPFAPYVRGNRTNTPTTEASERPRVRTQETQTRETEDDPFATTNRDRVSYKTDSFHRSPENSLRSISDRGLSLSSKSNEEIDRENYAMNSSRGTMKAAIITDLAATTQGIKLGTVTYNGGKTAFTTSVTAKGLGATIGRWSGVLSGLFAGWDVINDFRHANKLRSSDAYTKAASDFSEESGINIDQGFLRIDDDLQFDSEIKEEKTRFINEETQKQKRLLKESGHKDELLQSEIDAINKSADERVKAITEARGMVKAAQGKADSDKWVNLSCTGIGAAVGAGILTACLVSNPVGWTVLGAAACIGMCAGIGNLVGAGIKSGFFSNVGSWFS